VLRFLLIHLCFGVLKLSIATCNLGHGFLSFDPAQTIKKLLDCAERRAMQFLRVIEQVEMHAKLFVQGNHVVANNVKSAALGWAFRPEGADYNMPSRLDGVGHLPNISGSFIYHG